MFPPEYSPWGEVQHLEELCSGVFAVATASHGGIMVHRSIARTVLSPAARKHGFLDGNYYCFEEDCDAPVAIRELLDIAMRETEATATLELPKCEPSVKWLLEE